VADDRDLLIQLQPDAVLFVGDLSDGDFKLVKAIQQLPLPVAVILGNHDRGRDQTGEILSRQLKLLGERHCGWGLRQWRSPHVAVVGARPCSSGGGFYLSSAVEANFGPMSVNDSADRIVEAAMKAPAQWPLVVLAHSGPTGLGSDMQSPCGRDWKAPAIDWGDQDLAIALDRIRKHRVPQLVVFGHMHHELKRGQGCRQTFVQDRFGTVFLNAACVPRRGLDPSGRELCHLSWVEFVDGQLSAASHRWFLPDASVAYEQTLFQSSKSTVMPC
jgi:uncharacterized protein (TIGR04168 family)|tara:strand:+ start:1008 stop:1826 length:819 start_codon:yes stop_codon:yes gene_type:complete